MLAIAPDGEADPDWPDDMIWLSHLIGGEAEAGGLCKSAPLVPRPFRAVCDCGGACVPANWAWYILSISLANLGSTFLSVLFNLFHSPVNMTSMVGLS